MNKARRKSIDAVVALLAQAKAEIDAVATDERGAYDNLPEAIQASSQGDKLSENADELDDVSSEINDLSDRLSLLAGK